jgi:SSS family solute:Na+ symporter
MKYFRKKPVVVKNAGSSVPDTELTNGETEQEENKMVWIGKAAAFVSITLAVIFEWEDLLGISKEGGFTFIQKYTGFISPGVFAMFTLGMFWKRTTGAAAVAGLITGFLITVFFNSFAVALFGHETLLYTAFKNNDGIYEIPFLINMGWAFFFTVLVMVAVSMAGPKINPKAFMLDKEMFRLKPAVAAMVTAILVIIAALYVKFW